MHATVHVPGDQRVVIRYEHFVITRYGSGHAHRGTTRILPASTYNVRITLNGLEVPTTKR